MSIEDFDSNEIPYSARGQYLYLRAIQAHWPDFWRALNEAWRTHDKATILGWFEDFDVCDEWLQNTALDTIKAWYADPDGPNACLDPDWQWFYFDNDDPVFTPKFAQPFPLQSSCGNLSRWDLYKTSGSDLVELLSEASEAEPLDQFKRRLRQQFEEQLNNYVKIVRRFYCYDEQPSLFRDAATWTALRQSGWTWDRIADGWPGAKNSKDPESFIKTTVKRFADDIGLTPRSQQKSRTKV